MRNARTAPEKQNPSFPRDEAKGQRQGSKDSPGKHRRQRKTKNDDRTDYVYEKKGLHDQMTEKQSGFVTGNADFWRNLEGSLRVLGKKRAHRAAQSGIHLEKEGLWATVGNTPSALRGSGELTSPEGRGNPPHRVLLIAYMALALNCQQE
jgi:hypothetical protein